MGGMHFARGLAALAFCAILANPIPPGGVPLRERELEVDHDGYRYRRGKGQNNRRGKGLQAKPRKRANRMHISKRVRRKHRRAA